SLNAGGEQSAAPVYLASPGTLDKYPPCWSRRRRRTGKRLGMATETMRALVKSQPRQGIWMEEVPRPQVGTNEVLIKVEKTAICGTDLHIYKWDEWSQRTIKTPLVIGHEFVGCIVEMGPGVDNYQIGDRVSAEGHITCGLCR